MSMARRRTKHSTILFSDIEGSTALKEFGFVRWYEALEQHNQFFERAVARFGNAAKIIKHLGDGYLACFDAPEDAVECALFFQHAMIHHGWEPDLVLRSRIGIHAGKIGEIRQARHQDVVGRSVDLAARVMSVARGGQILLTGSIYDDVRDVFPSGTGIPELPPLQWADCGEWVLKGITREVHLYQVGFQGVSLMDQPKASDKAWPRGDAPHSAAEPWTPASGKTIPSKSGWVIEKSIGHGALGEVWVCRRGRIRHAFKFFVDLRARPALEAVRDLQIELDQVRLPEISRPVDVNLEKLPFYLETEFAEGGDLVNWSRANGGIARLSLNERIRIVEQVANAAGAAHRVGVIHGDIKPGNILMDLVEPSRPGEFTDGSRQGSPDGVEQPPIGGTYRPRLDDFGARRLFQASAAPLEAQVVQISPDGGSAPGETAASARAYIAPELKPNEPFTTRSDVYSLGVLLYQMTVGDFAKGIPTDWRSEIDDELLRDDISACVSKDPSGRISATDLASRLSRLQARRHEAAQHRARANRAQQWRRARMLALTAVALGAIVLTIIALLQIAGERSRTEQVKRFLIETLRSINPDRPGAMADGGITLEEYLQQATVRLDNNTLSEHPGAEAEVRAAIARAYLAISRHDAALAAFDRALERATQWKSRPSAFDRRLHIERAQALLARNGHQDVAAAARLLETIDAGSLPPSLAPDMCVAQATLLAAQGRHREAAAAFAEAEKMLASREQKDSLQRVEMAIRTGQMLCDCAEPEKASPILSDSLGRLAKLDASGGSLERLCKTSLGKCHARMGNVDEGVKLLTEVYHECGRVYGIESIQSAYAAGDIALALEQNNRWEEATAWRRIGHDFARRHENVLPPTLRLRFHATFGICLVSNRKWQEAAEPLNDAMTAARAVNTRELPQELTNLVVSVKHAAQMLAAIPAAEPKPN